VLDALLPIDVVALAVFVSTCLPRDRFVDSRVLLLVTAVESSWHEASVEDLRVEGVAAAVANGCTGRDSGDGHGEPRGHHR
jgi:hypothetical protein